MDTTDRRTGPTPLPGQRHESHHIQEIARNPYSLKAWLRYLEAKTQARPVKRYLLYERALKFLPGSYKLWHAYLQERRRAVEGKVPVTHARYQILVNTYERCVACALLLASRGWVLLGRGLGTDKSPSVAYI